jgi:hypothetical protein
MMREIVEMINDEGSKIGEVETDREIVEMRNDEGMETDREIFEMILNDEGSEKKNDERSWKIMIE